MTHIKEKFVQSKNWLTRFKNTFLTNENKEKDSKLVLPPVANGQALVELKDLRIRFSFLCRYQELGLYSILHIASRHVH